MLTETLERKAANHIFWSPLGQFLVLGQVDSNSQNSGMLEFVDTADMTVMSSGEHMGATELEWCPTGRFVTTTVSHFYQKVCCCQFFRFIYLVFIRRQS